MTRQATHPRRTGAGRLACHCVFIPPLLCSDGVRRSASGAPIKPPMYARAPITHVTADPRHECLGFPAGQGYDTPRTCLNERVARMHALFPLG